MNFLKGLLKFSPVFLLAGLMIAQYDALIAAPIAAIYAFIVAGITEKIKFQDSLNAAMKSVNNILIALFILMFAYAMASMFMSSGVGASVVNIALSLGVTGYGDLVGDVCRMRADIHVAQSYRRRKSVSHGMRHSRRRMLWR